MEHCKREGDQIHRVENRWLKIMRRVCKDRLYDNLDGIFPAVFYCTCRKHYFMDICEIVDGTFCDSSLTILFDVKGGRYDYKIVSYY